MGAADADATRGAAGGVLGLPDEGTTLGLDDAGTTLGFEDAGTALGFPGGTAVGRFDKGGGPPGRAEGVAGAAGLLPMRGRTGAAPLRATDGAMGGFGGGAAPPAGFAGGFGATLAAFGAAGAAGAADTAGAAGVPPIPRCGPVLMPGGTEFGCVREAGTSVLDTPDVGAGVRSRGALAGAFNAEALDGTGGGAILAGATEPPEPGARGSVLCGRGTEGGATDAGRGGATLGALGGIGGRWVGGRSAAII